MTKWKKQSLLSFPLLRGERDKVGNSWKERELGFEALYILLFFVKYVIHKEI